MKEKPILIFISYHFPPSERPSVRRNYGFYRELKDWFSEKYVITITQGQSENFILNELQIPDNNLIHIPNKDPALLFKKNEEQIIQDSKRKGITKVLIKIRQTYPFAHLIGKGNWVYVNRLKKKIDQILKSHPKNPIVIYSSFSPFGDHIASSDIKKKYPQRVKWIADFRDLFSDDYYKLYYLPKLRKKVLQKVVNRADLVTTISNEFQKIIQEDIDAPVITTYNGLNEHKINRSPEKKFRITYAGSLISDKRNPGPIFEAIRNLVSKKEIQVCDIIITYAGQDGNKFLSIAQDYGIENLVENKGFLAQSEVNELLAKSHYALLLTSSTEEYKGVLTSKFFVYLENHVPIINIINGNRDEEFEQIFSELNCGIINYTKDLNKSYLQSFLKDEINKFTADRNYIPVLKSDITKSSLFSWKTGAKKILNHLDV